MCKKKDPWAVEARLTKAHYFEQLSFVATIITGLALLSWLFFPDLRQLSRAVWLGATIFMGMRYLKNFGFDFIGKNPNGNQDQGASAIEDVDVV